MKKLLCLLLLGLSSAAFAEDEYGARFNNETPPGLAEATIKDVPQIAMDEAAQDVQDIMPASGESQTPEPSDENPPQ